MRVNRLNLLAAIVLVCVMSSLVQAGRTTIPLDGTWQIAQGDMENVPTEFGATVPVPGLVDMAEPAFEEVGVKSEKRQAFWYRKQFKIDGSIPKSATLMVHKAKYGTAVSLNGKYVG